MVTSIYKNRFSLFDYEFTKCTFIFFFIPDNINLTDEHLFVFYSTLLELQKILESALVLTKKNAGEKMQEAAAQAENVRKTVPLLTKMR